MGVIPSGTARSAATTVEAQSFWQRIAHSLDRFFAQRSRRAVPASLASHCADDAKAIMSRPRGYAAGKRHERVVQLFVTLLTMVIADWRKLVAEVSHAFRRKARSSRGEQT